MFDPDLSRKLVAEAREDREHLDVGDWIWVVRGLLKPMTAQLDAALAEVEYLREALGACDREALSAITRLTRERDEARAESERLMIRAINTSNERDEARAADETWQRIAHERHATVERMLTVYEAAKAWGALDREIDRRSDQNEHIGFALKREHREALAALRTAIDTALAAERP